MVKGELDEVPGEAFAAVGFIDPDVTEVGKAGAVRDDAEEGGLGGMMEGAKDESGVFGSALDAFERDAGCPVGGSEPGMDAGPIDSGEVGGELIIAEGGGSGWWGWEVGHFLAEGIWQTEWQGEKWIRGDWE